MVRTLRVLVLTAVALAALVYIAGCGKGKKPVAVEEEVEAPDPPAPPANIPALVKKLKSPTPAIQVEGIEALAKAAPTDPGVVPAVVEALADKANRGAGRTSPNEPASTREAAVMALLRCGPAGETAFAEKAVPILVEALKDPAPAVREHAATALARAGERARPAADPLWVAAGDPDQFVRAAAFEALKDAQPESSRPLAALLTHKTAAVRDQAADNAGAFPKLPADAVPDLVKALKDANPTVRSAAAGLLAQLGPAAAPALPELLKLVPTAPLDDDGNLKYAAYPVLRAIAAVGEPAVEALVPLLADKEAHVRWQAAHVLGSIGAPAKAAVPALEKAMIDPVGPVAGEAVWAFVMAGGDSAKAVARIEPALKTEDPVQKAGVLELVARLGPTGRKLADKMLPFLADEEPDIRRAAVEFVASLPGPDAKSAVPALGKMLLDKDEGDGLRRRVADLLGDLGPDAGDAGDALGKAVAADRDPAVRRAAADALAAVGPAGKAALPGLIRATADANSDADVRVRAVAAVAAVGAGDRSAADAVVKAAQDAKSPEVRAAAVAALGRFTPPDPAAVARLADIAKSDRIFSVRLAAFRTLAVLGPAAAAARPTVEPLAAGPHPDVALWAKVVVARIDGKPADANPPIRVGLDSKSAAEKLAAATAFVLLSPVEPADVPKLAALMRDRADEIRRASAASAGEVGPPAKAAVGDLTKLVRDRDSDVALAAVVALGKVGAKDAAVVAALQRSLRSPLLAKAARASLHQLGVADVGPPPDPDQRPRRKN